MLTLITIILDVHDSNMRVEESTTLRGEMLINLKKKRCTLSEKKKITELIMAQSKNISHLWLS